MFKSVIKKLATVFLIASILNLVWENIHSVLYFLPSGGQITEAMLLRSTFIDALLITVLAGPFIFWPWFSQRVWLAIPIGIFVSIIIELRALFAGRWAYTQAMPIIPLINTGLTPTIQLGLIGYVIYKLVLKKPVSGGIF